MTDRPPRVSVIIATFDYRVEADFVASWTQRQDADPGQYEVIVVSHGRDPEVDRQIRQVLRPGDQLIQGDGPDENRMFRYNKGAQNARGSVFLFTEDHVIAAPDCMTKLIKAMADPGIRSASFPTSDQACHPLGEAEGRLCQSFLDRGVHDAPWKQVQVRGFVIRRELFLELGEFPTGYAEFGPTAFGIEMFQRGHLISRIVGPTVTHVNHHSLEGMCDDAMAYFFGEGLYRSSHSLEHCERFLGACDSWRHFYSQSRRYAWVTMKSALGIALQNKRKLIRSPKWISRLFSQCLFQLPILVLGKTWHVSIAKRRLAKCKKHWRKGYSDQSRQDELFERLWSALANYGRLDSLRRLRPRTGRPRLIAGRMAAESLHEENLQGFHQCEEIDGKSFRWTQPLASIRIPKNSDARQITLETLAEHSSIDNNPIALLWNDRLIPRSQVQIASARIRITLPDSSKDPRADGDRITIACPDAKSAADRRSLGVPIVAVELGSDAT